MQRMAVNVKSRSMLFWLRLSSLSRRQHSCEKAVKPTVLFPLLFSSTAALTGPQNGSARKWDIFLTLWLVEHSITNPSWLCIFYLFVSEQNLQKLKEPRARAATLYLRWREQMLPCAQRISGIKKNSSVNSSQTRRDGLLLASKEEENVCHLKQLHLEYARYSQAVQ